MGKARLSRNKVLAIRDQYDVGYTMAEIARAHGINRNTVGNIVNGKTHKRVVDRKHAPFPVDTHDLTDRAKRAAEMANRSRRH